MNDMNHCSSGQGACGKSMIKCLIPTLVVFAVIFGFYWLYHGVLMMPQYEATAAMWRTEEQMQEYYWVCFVSKLITAALITCLYCWMAKGCASGGKCLKKGAKFGLKIGLLLGMQQWASVIWLPISMEMAVYWLVGDVIMGVLIGVVLALLTQKMCNKPAM